MTKLDDYYSIDDGELNARIVERDKQMTLRVKLEVVPYGDEDKAYEIGRLDIFNKGPAVSEDGTSLGGFHEYGVIELTPKDGAMHDFTVLHRRWEGAWKLVDRVLSELTIEGPK